MQFDNALSARMLLQDTTTRSETFAQLVRELFLLPSELRGAEALELSARLLEIAAFELAGRLASAEIGAMIHCSAELSQRAADLSLDGFARVDPGESVVN